MTKGSGYAGTKKLAADLTDPEQRDTWLNIIKECYECPHEEFPKRWLSSFRHALLNLIRLQRYGILEKTDSVRGGHRAYYRMLDREGVGRALKELGVRH